LREQQKTHILTRDLTIVSAESSRQWSHNNEVLNLYSRQLKGLEQKIIFYH
jgi:hypothetical protein